jgi:hypothetical protein
LSFVPLQRAYIRFMNESNAQHHDAAYRCMPHTPPHTHTSLALHIG